nr:chemotaxis response regulator protein-glutamate methylesterase [uncultured Lichenicoccus sp.]
MSIRVLIVDDSALIRQLLTEMLQSDPGIEVIATASDPIVAREKIRQLSPDVITLDIEMPRMDGLSFLERLMALRPMPVVVVSTLTQKGTDIALQALEIGAVDFVAKPTIGVRDGLLALREEIVAKVKAAALARPRSRTAPPQPVTLSIDPLLSSAGRLVAIGASTGGVEALQRLLINLPAHCPAILITQHMPPGFTASFARRLDEICLMSVCEAEQGQVVTPGHVYIANGARHLELARSGTQYSCRLHDGPAVSGHRPSVDVLFQSFAGAVGANALGIILTGMGRDGAAGLLAMRSAGARTLGQNEASCLIYGMSKAAKDIGAIEAEMSLEHLAGAIVNRPR